MKIGIISGYFNPLHYGHIEYIQTAKKQCNKLIAIVNNDFQVKLKKSKPFMDEIHRCNIIKSLKGVYNAIISIDKDPSVCETIKFIKNKYNTSELLFFNSGDRVGSNINSAETILCNTLGIKYVEIPLKKLYSSSELLKNI